ncbi:uncharacterized protein TNCV_401811 [Trichonephila clavipes]|nr:uncharacterized protein TNCV_401811 [Trichonephila clavipes]
MGQRRTYRRPRRTTFRKAIDFERNNYERERSIAGRLKGEFERTVIVGARDMEHRILELTMQFGFSRTTISEVYREYRESGKTSNLRHRCGRKRSCKGPTTTDENN